MKKWYASLIVVSMIMAMQSLDVSHNLHSSASGALAGHTGSPADGQSCARSGCHSSTAIPTMGLITSNIPPTGYVPGQTYTISATATDPNRVKFGFQVSPQDASGNYLGTMQITDPSATKLTGIKYITHTFGGTSAPGGSRTWNFDWVAPAAGTGDVTFYGAFNYSNNNGSTSGDQIRTSSLTVTEDVSTGLANSGDPYDTRIYPVPATDNINISLNLKDAADVNIDLIDLQGKMITSIISREYHMPGDHSFSFNLPDDVVNGIYFVRISSSHGLYMKRLAIYR